MPDKAENAKNFGKLLAEAWENTPSFICSNDDYAYCLYPADKTKEKWIEGSLTFPDSFFDTKEITPKKAIALLIEELKVLPSYGAETIVNTKAKFDALVARLAKLA
ncbi:MAG: hypothetical protein KGY80_07485 [Candidatus Thorarchaeota archaeon]|nr:hypothetical protein [Candidatus Thorarchaeota archaeon]